MKHKRWVPIYLLTAFVFAGCASESTETAAAEEEAMGEAEMATSAISARGLAGCYLARGTVDDALGRPSPLSNVEFSYASGEGQLCYGAPSANGREIMGGLVPYDEPWRAGANEPTIIHLTGPASVGGVALEAGTYSLYTVPGEAEWEFFINSNFERWGIPIDESVRGTEIGSFTVTPESTGALVETLNYRFEPNAENTMGDIVMEWEETRVRFHVHPGEM